jgi:hypothetical protein
MQIGRRWSAAISLFLSGICMAVCGLIMDNVTALVIISMMGRFCITFSINTVMQLNYEIMPTQLRAQGAGLSNSLGQMCNILSPYVVYSVSDEFIFMLSQLLSDKITSQINEEDSRGGKNRNTGERQQNSENQVSSICTILRMPRQFVFMFYVLKQI